MSTMIGKTRRRLTFTPRGKDVTAAVSLVTLIILVSAAFLGSKFLLDPATQDVSNGLLPPGAPGHLLGTDELGRDQLSRVLHGAQTSMSVSFLATVLAAVAGIALGVWAGYRGGRTDEVIMRLVDVQLTIPGIILVLLVVTVLRPSYWVIVGVLAFSGWVVFARQARTQVLSIRDQDMVVSLISLGMTRPRLLVRHVLPNIAGPLLTLATLEMAQLLLAESALGYLGLGVPPPQPTLGAMISSGQVALTAGIWWPVVVPGVAISLIILCVNVLGDWMRDRLDPRMQRSLRSATTRAS
jgi:peptide/nickel transport system permease protein